MDVTVTLNESMMIKEFVKKAKEENAREPRDTKYIWRVRGSPKNGLTIRRFKKATPDHTIEATKVMKIKTQERATEKMEVRST